MFRRFTISVGNFIVTLVYVLSLIGIIISGLGMMAFYNPLAGLGVIVGGVLLLVSIFYVFFLFIDMREQLVAINTKLNKTENKENC